MDTFTDYFIGSTSDTDDVINHKFFYINNDKKASGSTIFANILFIWMTAHKSHTKWTDTTIIITIQWIIFNKIIIPQPEMSISLHLCMFYNNT